MIRKYWFICIAFLAFLTIAVSLVFAQTRGGGFSAPAEQGNWYDESVTLVDGAFSYDFMNAVNGSAECIVMKIQVPDFVIGRGSYHGEFR